MPIDYAYDTDHDLVFEGGDFVRTESTFQHQQDLLLMKKGANRLFLFVGVGIQEAVLNENAGDILAEARKQLNLDGQTVQYLKFIAQGQIEVKAYYDVDRG